MKPNEAEADFHHYQTITTSPSTVYNELLREIVKLQKRIEALEATK